MKKTIFISALLLSAHVISKAQNTPNGSALPTNTLTGKVPYPKNYDQSPNTAPSSFNYTRKYSPLVPLSYIPSFDSSAGTGVPVTTLYSGGWGERLMEIQRNNSDKDIVMPFDQRPWNTSISYLPYSVSANSKFRNAPFTEQQAYYHTKFSLEDTTAYSKSISYSDHGQPTAESYSPGKAMVGQKRGTTTTSSYNDATDTVYDLSYSGANVCKSGVYPASQLLVTKSMGQHGATLLQYSDKSGRLLCKKAYAGQGMGTSGWLVTYYVYNDMGKIVCIVPPKAANQLVSNTCLSNIDKLCFTYAYDEYGNITKKTTPGRNGADLVVYDKLHRPVLSQNAVLKAAGKWAFVVYDIQGRARYSGLYNTDLAQSYWDGVLRGTTTPTVYSGIAESQTLENRLQNGFKSAYPTSLYNCDIQSYSYYDTYDATPANSITFDTTYNNDYLTGAEMVAPKPFYFANGKLVATKTKIVDNGVANNFTNTPWITTVYFYDEKGQIIQTRTKNPWNTSNWDISATQYNFIGRPVLNILKTYSWAGCGKPQLKISTKNIYNENTGRLEEVQQQLDTHRGGLYHLWNMTTLEK